MYSLKDNAHTVLLPAFGTTRLSDTVKRFLSNGGCSILLGETRAEYVAREMTLQRRQAETAEIFLALRSEAASLAGSVLVAVDQEIGGICRLHDLVPPFPPREQIAGVSTDEFETIASEVALAARQLGVNCFLAPILDIVTGDNPWLKGRTWSTDPTVVARISSAYIRGLQANGIAATAKHFPGYSHIPLDPAVAPDARMTEPPGSVESSVVPFADAINNGVEIVMTGPAIVEAFDSERPASVSPSVIRILRERLGFKGVVMSDDLDGQATLRGRPITQVAVDALNAGSDHLLIADFDDQVDQIVLAITNAVSSGELPEIRLTEAATKVRALAAKYSRQTPVLN
jgi:beta-N-acetylhexosaminidase